MAVGAVFAIGELGGIVGDAVFVKVVLQGCLDGLLRQHRAVQLMSRQAGQRFRHSCIGQLHGIRNGLALDHLRSHGAGGNGAAAAKGLKLHIHDDVPFDLQVDLHNIAALGIANAADTVGVLDGP